MTSLENIFEDNPIAIINHNNTPLFCAQDLTHVLGVDKRGVQVAVGKLPDDMKQNLLYRREGATQSRNMWFGNEPGLYWMVCRSNKASEENSIAHRFMRWVTEDVLPSIRKTGKYEIEEMQKQIDDLTEQTTYLEIEKRLININLLKKTKKLIETVQDLKDTNYILSIGVSNIVKNTCAMTNPNLTRTQQRRLKFIIGKMAIDQHIEKVGLNSNWVLTKNIDQAALRTMILQYNEQFRPRL